MNKFYFIFSTIIFGVWLSMIIVYIIIGITMKKDAMFDIAATLAGGFFVAALRFVNQIREAAKKNGKIIVPNDKDR